MEMSATLQDPLDAELHKRSRKKGLTNRILTKITRKKFNPRQIRGILVGSIATLSLNEFALHIMLRLGVEQGVLSPYINDIFFVSLAMMEVLVAPFISWMGQNRRITTILIWLSLSALSILPLFFLTFTTVRQENDDLCKFQPLLQPQMSTIWVFRILAIGLMGVMTALARISIWSHSVAALEMNSPSCLVRDFGLSIALRIMSMVMSNNMTRDILERRMMLQIVAFIMPIIIKTLAIYLTVPRQIPVTDDDDEESQDLDARSFFPTMYRVLSNINAMTHAVSAGIFAAAIWGFGLYSSSLARAKYHVTKNVNFTINFADQQRLLGLFLVILIVGGGFKKPLRKQFNKMSAIKKTVTAPIVAIIMMLVMALLSCDRTMVGLDEYDYNKPVCSMRCGGCYPEFAPVCDVTNMATYISPCHAGCSFRKDLNGSSILQQCSCLSPNSVMVEGICNPGKCSDAYDLHQMLFAVLMACAGIALTMHGTIIIRSVQLRDISTAMGVTLSVVALLAFVGGHLLFHLISVWRCAWIENGECLLHNSKFPLTLAITSVILVATSVIINLTSYFIVKKSSIVT